MMCLVAVTYMFCIGSHVHLVYIVNMNDTITGTIPSEMGLLLNLVELEIAGSLFLQGSLPSHIGQLSNLKKLLVHNLPEMTGSIPSEFGLLLSLDTLWLCKLSRNITLPFLYTRV